MRVSIAGASGYAGGELMRLLENHPQCEVVAVPECRHLWVGEKFVRIAWNEALARIRPEMPELSWTWDGEMDRWNDLTNGNSPLGKN